jgi:peptidoglycan/xylan/chitin deacetylase (PgdA/CDA1 family)
MKVIIRDDDTSFFTQPALLDKIYEPLWKNNYPICLAVIPAQRSDVIVEHRPNRPYDPSIPAAYRGQTMEHPVLRNRELCAYLNEKAREGLVEICLHGYSHSYMEFTTDDESLLKQKLAVGKQLLAEALPDATIRTFIAPYDRLSKTALQLVYKAGFHLCTNSENLRPFPSLSGIYPYAAYRLSNGLRLFTCNEYLFTHRDNPDESLAKARERLTTESILIIANHYWTFFYDWDGPNASMLQSWYRFVDDLLANSNCKLTTFSGCEVQNFDGQLY